MVLAIEVSPNKKLMLNEIFALFKKTEYLNYELTADELSEIHIGGPVDLKNTDEHECVYTDKIKMQKIIDYLNSIPLVKADRDELPNISADVPIGFYDTNGNQVGGVLIYGQVFIEKGYPGQLYRSKDGRIIEGLENIQF